MALEDSKADAEQAQVILLTFEYLCDFCGREIVGADKHRHGADYGRYPVPRHVTRIGPHHACIGCEEKAMQALPQPNAPYTISNEENRFPVNFVASPPRLVR